MKKCLLLILAVLLAGGPAWANPQFSHTEAGDVRIEEKGAVYSIFSADRSIGAFTRFSNAAGETIHSIQASADHSVIFKVTGGSPSEIFGTMNANSHVFLVNPNGILFGPGSQVNAPGLTAAAMDLKSADFDSREFRFQSPAQGGGVRNEGRLSAAPGGYIALIGAAVENRGVIDAPRGSAILASGASATVGLDGDGGISVKLTESLGEAVYDLAGDRIENGLNNSGVITAAGGAVLLTADAMEEVFDQAINHTGIIEAVTVEEKNGVIVLSGGPKGVVVVDGSLDASGSAGEKGGAIEVTGEYIGIADHASLDASGGSGGGTVLIGGDYKGENPDIQNAKAVFFASDAVVRADAGLAGDGGRVIVWSDEGTQIHGTISALGASGGANGFVETSGRDYLGVNGARVLAGQWLLDPYNVVISASSSINGSFSGTNPITWIPTGVSNIQASSIQSNLDAGTDVIVSTSGGGAMAGNITLGTPLAKSAAVPSTLTLDADGSIFINDTISATGSVLHVELFAGSSTGSHIDIIASINTNGGDFTADAPSGSVKIGANITTLGGDVDISGNLVELKTSLTISTAAGTPGDVDISSKMVPTATGIDLTIDTHNLSVNEGGDIYLDGIMSNAVGGFIVNDFTINAGGAPRGDVYLDDAYLFGPDGGDTPLVSISGGLIYIDGQIRVTGDAGITVDSDDTVYLGFLNANSDSDTDIGDVSITGDNGIYDINGNAPNILADTLTLATDGDDVGFDADRLEAVYNTLNGSGVLYPGVIYLRGFVSDEDSAAEEAGVILDGYRIVGGENFEEFLADASTTTEAADESSEQEEQKEEEEEGGALVSFAVDAGIPSGDLVTAPESFPDEKPVDAGVFQTCA